MRLYHYFLSLIMTITTTGVYAGDDSGVTLARYKGRLGEHNIAMTLKVKNSQIIRDSHYFYFRHLADIPLTGTTGSFITAKEPGGGIFVLHFVGGDSKDNATPIFLKSTGLSGTWTGPDGTVFPVSLSGGGGPDPDTPQGSRRYQDITGQSDAAFEALVQEFYKAVMANKRVDAARYVTFPLRVNTSSGSHFYVKNLSELTVQWDRIFSPTWLKLAAREAPHEMNVINGLAVLGPGLAYFGEGGVEVINAAP